MTAAGVLCAAPAPARAGGGAGTLELGAHGGWHIWSGDNELGIYEDSPLRTTPENGPVFGVRTGYALTDRLSAEAEFSMAPSETIPTDLLPLPAGVNVFQGRVSGVLHLLTGDLRPFVLGGAGALVARSNDQDVLHDDTDAYAHVGLGLKVDLNEWFGLRLDAAMLLPPTTAGDGLTGDFELTVGPIFTVGGAPAGPDADGDGLYDSVEEALGSDPDERDTDRDGISDGDEDDDRDTLRNLDETGGGVRLPDTDRDRTPDVRDADDDNDGVPTRQEREDTLTGGHDLDRDAAPAWLDPDADGDGRTDGTEGREDADGDGLRNYLDPDDHDGPAADADGDGLMNRVEAALGLDPRSRDTDGDGAPDGEEDPDGDGRNNLAETQMGTVPTDGDGDGVVDALDPEDRDGDGIPDLKDGCPDEAENENGFEDHDGCSDELPEEVRRFSGVIEGITFEPSKAALRPPSFKVLDDAAKVLRANPSVRLSIEGHSDPSGDPERNRTLSDERAQAVRLYLVSKGVSEDRIAAEGFGVDRPIADNATPEGRARNRRVEFRIVGGQPQQESP